MLLIFLGIMTGQFLYMCTLWLQRRKPEYAYYILHYIIFVYFLFGLSYSFLFSPEYVQQYQSWFDLLQAHPLHIFNYYLYIRFAQHYLETPKLFPKKDAQAVLMMKGVWVCTILAILAWFFLDIRSTLYQNIYLIISVSLMIWAMYLVYLIYTMKNRQSLFLFRGSLLLSAGILITYILLALAGQGRIAGGPELFYPSVLGVLGEIYFVNAGLNYKAGLKRKQLIRIQQQWIDELERNRLLLQEKEAVRNDLSLQLNKEIGTTLNGINLFAQHSILLIRAEQWEKVKEVLSRIAQDANRMVTTMSEIVWMLSADNDTLARSFVRIRSYTARCCRERGLHCRMDGRDGRDILVKINMAARRALYQGYKAYFQFFIEHTRNRFELKLEARGYWVEIIFRGDCSQEMPEREKLSFPGLAGFNIISCEMTGGRHWELRLEFDAFPSENSNEQTEIKWTAAGETQ